MPIFFEVHFKDGSASVKKAWVSHASDTIYISAPAGKEIDYTLFDPASNILKTVNFQKSFEELSAQAERAKNMIDRYDALQALRTYEVDKKRSLLIRMFNKSDFNIIQNEIMQQLGKDKTPATVELFKKALRDKDFMVRRSAIQNMEDFPQELLPLVENLLQDSSYVTIEVTLRKLCKLNTAKAATYLQQTKDVMGFDNNVRMAWLELKCKDANIDSVSGNKFKKQLVTYTSNQYEFGTRVQAIAIVERLGYCDNDFIKNLFNASLYSNSRLSNPATKVLKLVLRNADNKQLAKSIFEAGTWKEWQRKILEGILNA